MSTNRLFSRRRLSVIPAIVVLMSGCTVHEVSTPTPVGVSELGIGMSITASPEFLPRDGSSISTITVKTFDSNGTPTAGQRVHLETTAGTLSASEVSTGNDGSVQFMFIAPGMNESVNCGPVPSCVRITATPIKDTNLQNANPRYVDIQVNGPDIPVASFNFSPSSPAQFALVSFDASTTALSGRQCGSACTYKWTFPDGSTATEQFTEKRFQYQGQQAVTLTVTAQAGTSSTVTKTVTVGAAQVPTASLTFSPTNPTPATTVNFNASGSQAHNGATIKEYRWNFGGATSNGGLVTTVPENTAVFGASATSKTYLVTLTVVDSNDQTATITTNVTVAP
jgi:hypothetical protein